MMFHDIKDRMAEPEVAAIIALAVFAGSPDGVAKEVSKYRTSDKLHFYGWHENETVVGVCGFEAHAAKVEIHLIAVAKERQRRGIGSAMVLALQKEYHLPLEAETDDDAVDFYRKCGFVTTIFQHSEWEVTRYTCVLKETLELHIPSAAELEYRRFLIADEETMAYNHGYGDNGGGTYQHTLEQVLKWWNYWHSEGNFYAYIVRVFDNMPVGEVSIHFPADYGYPKKRGVGWIGVVVEGRYRRKGYGEIALRLLVEYAFNTLHLTRLLDDIPADREFARRIFERVGFKRNVSEGVMELMNGSPRE